MLNIKRTAASLIMAAAIAAAIPALTYAPLAKDNLSAATEAESGIVSQEKSLSELRRLYNSITTYDQLFATEGSNKSPYKIYTLTKDAKQAGEDWINYYRYAARVAPISLDEDLNTDAAHGALLDAAYGTLSHYPFYDGSSYNRPSGMSQAMFNRGEYATQTSNLSYRGSSSSNNTYVIGSSIQGQMSDSSSESNINCVGHRRWLINPYTQTMGIGSAYANAGYHVYYTDVRVFSSSYNDFYSSSYGQNKTTSNPGDYSFIAWPASGYNLSETFSPNDPWSVSLNTNIFSAPDASAITVKITRLSDNKTCTITGAAYSSFAKKYLVTSNMGYGAIPYCFIFSPGTDFLGTSALSGKYKVSVSGLKTSSGAATTLDYTVDFEPAKGNDPTATPTPKATATPTATPIPKATATATPTPKSSSGSSDSGTKISMSLSGTIVCGKSAKASVTVSPSGKSVTFVSSDSKVATVDSSGNVKGIMAGKATITAKTSDGAKTSITVQILYKDVTSSKDFWYEPTYYLTNKSVVKGYDKQTRFKPANECTRAQMVTFIWRLQGEPDPKSSACKFSDVKKTDYFYKACIWGSENHIVEGYKDGTFGPQIVCARRHAVTFLWRLAKQPQPKTNTNKFKDVKTKDYFYKATLWASEKGILAGYSDGTFRPNGKCLRRQMVTFLYKYDKYVNGKG
ncbi:MAG: S-layer homology domain-containing protein [Clostridiales bacterium]|nr:S-layer homology domain-containing protein [Clostridiales bacterium]